MNDKDKIAKLGGAVIILARRLLKLESSEKFRSILRTIINDVGFDICEFKPDSSTGLEQNSTVVD